MEKNIYMLLNQVETDLEEYQEYKKSDETERYKGYKTEDLKEDELEESKARILKKLRKEKHHKIALRRLPGVAAILVICLLSIGSAVYAATDGAVFDYMYTFLTGGVAYEKTESGIMGETSVSTVAVTAEAALRGEGEGFPLFFEEGRLYFTGDGGKTDITEKISETEPYYMDVIDETGILHRFNIGGRAEEGCFGYNEMIFDEKGVFRAGTGSLGEKIDMSSGMPEWYRKGVEEATGLEIPPSTSKE